VWNRGSASGPVDTGGTLHGETHSVSIGVSPGAVDGLLPGANPFLVASHHIANRPTDAANLGQVARVDSDIEHRTHTPITATHANQMTRRGVRTQPQPVASRRPRHTAQRPTQAYRFCRVRAVWYQAMCLRANNRRVPPGSSASWSMTNRSPRYERRSSSV
jgi:hypothetical protein